MQHSQFIRIIVMRSLDLIRIILKRYKYLGLAKACHCHARASIRPSNSFGPTSVRLCPNSILRCPNDTELSLELSICLVCSFVYNLLIVLDFAIPNYPELLDLLLVSFPLAPLSRSQIPSHHSLIRAPNSHHSFVILRSLITVAHPLTR